MTFPEHNPALLRLRQICRGCPFEPHSIQHLLDKTGRYDELWEPDFPFVVRFFDYSSRHHTASFTWHERLELFLVLEGEVRFQMGEQKLTLNEGDLLVVDNLKLHRVVDFDGFRARVIVVSFLPDFVYTLGSSAFDYAFLIPFHAKLEGHTHLLQPNDAVSADVYLAIGKLIKCFQAREPFFRTGCRVFLLEVLHHLALRFQTSETLRAVFLRQIDEDRPLQAVLDYIEKHADERLLANDLARLAKMSRQRFRRQFKRLTGMTLGKYVCRVRLNNAARMLQDVSTRSVAEIAAAAGFSDQSYFDRLFREEYGHTPVVYRKQFWSKRMVSPVSPPSASKPVKKPSDLKG